MNSLADWFAGFNTITGMTRFMAGFLSAYVIMYIYCKRKSKPFNINWHYVGVAIGLVAIIFVSLQTQAAYTLATDTAIEAKTCQVINAKNDHWSEKQRTALGQWLLALLDPPQEIAVLQDTDPLNPKIRKWGVETSRHYSDIIQNAQKEQDANKAPAYCLEHP